MTKSASDIRHVLSRFLKYNTTQFKNIYYRNSYGRCIYVISLSSLQQHLNSNAVTRLEFSSWMPLCYVFRKYLYYVKLDDRHSGHCQLWHKYRIIRNYCLGFTKPVIHKTLEIAVCSCTDGSRNSQSFLLWCVVCSSYAFLCLERSSLRWRRTAVRRRFVCLNLMNFGQLQLSSGNSTPNSGKNHHLTIPFEGGTHSFKRQGACVKETITADMLHTVWNELDYRVDVCRITKGAHIEHL